ncbi:hypothetical protein DUNSADRAFT_17204 [Dunaliella salina]|uniref:JmjC domain-containing protein n=1 Tax=Dunaliella salina TaxID=3046 RepID=A0ABQ7G273_DUNSA|nr:hypothetical protein DUNSADRAFT_17204 [Dunaliella salina]|eukprot:KAF5828704.1 hypothetical protein DUNSADRAFT_17204 [Dunaliella salina]
MPCSAGAPETCTETGKCTQKIGASPAKDVLECAPAERLQPKPPENGEPSSEIDDPAVLRDKRIRAAKRAARSELSVSKGDWRRHNLAASNILTTEGIVDRAPRVHCQDLTPAQFAERFERPRQPVVITGATDSWSAHANWRPEVLAERYRDHKFKVGSRSFPGTFGDRSTSKSMLKDYTVPHFFAEDLFQHVGKKKRPPFRWVVVGPPRSGSGLHIDPLATSAWNALVHGHKRWALFPPGTPKELLLPREPGIEREAVSWFGKVYPRTLAPEWPAARPMDIIQGPGEIVYVPNGWWHAVLNLDLTVAVTQNFASTSNFEHSPFISVGRVLGQSAYGWSTPATGASNSKSSDIMFCKIY